MSEFYGYDDFVEDLFGFPEEVGFGKGLFKYHLEGECHSEPYDYVPTSVEKASRTFGVLANLCIVTAFAGVLVNNLDLHSGKVKVNMVLLATKIVYIAAFICTLLTFVTIKDCNRIPGNGSCTLGAAGILNVLNTFILLGLAIASWFVTTTPADEAPVSEGEGKEAGRSSTDQGVGDEPPPQDDTIVRKTIELTPKGKKITEEVTHPDGRKTITRTTTETFEGEAEVTTETLEAEAEAEADV